ncbi:MAG: DUF2169 domain-containing protein [Byssovorax sp.]
MDVVSTCPLRVASIVWQPRPSAWTLTVVCKATFVLSPGESRLSDVQEEPTPHDLHLGGDPRRSLYAASDLAPFKPRADVILVGHAFAPGRTPARRVPVRLNVGEVDKRLDAWCDRIFWQDGRLLEGQPVTQVALAPERAAGGPGTSNPVGMRFDAAPDAHGAVPIPNLQPAGIEISRRGETFAPIACGPVAPGWPGRVDKLSRHAVGWSHGGWAARPLPPDVDPAYFNSAPVDQQTAPLQPDERILLENLHPDHPLLVTRLPGLRPRAHLSTGGESQEEIELIADTLWIDTDRGLATVVWRGRFPLSHAREEGRIVVSMQTGASAVAPARHAAEDPTMLGDLGGKESGTLQLPASDVATILGHLRARSDASALPFKAASSVWSGFHHPPTATPEAALPEDTGTLYGARSPTRAPLPFAATVAPLERTPEREPDRIGPLATMDIAAPEPAVPAAAEPDEADSAPSPVDARAPGAPPPIDEHPIERCAAITASIARRRPETAQILEENRLDAATWAALQQHWSEAITRETSRGKTALLHAFDAAYVAQIEAERGPIRTEEYARLVVASERGTLADTLAAMTLPRGAMMRIERTWLAKTADDPAVARELRRAVTAERET